MRSLILTVLLSAAAAAQSLPDAPSVLCARSPEVCKPVVPGTWLPDHHPNPGFWVWVPTSQTPSGRCAPIASCSITGHSW
ncbi:MAG: hypothetical protein WBC78_09940 [Candidatus Sulfotelmatobacter sp.]